MGIKEELEQLRAQREAAIAEEEARKIAEANRLRQKEIEDRERERRATLVQSANRMLGDEAMTRILAPELTRTLSLLNGNLLPTDKRWSLQALVGRGSYESGGSIDGEGGWTAGSSYDVDYDGLVLARERDIYTYKATRSFIGFEYDAHATSISYDLIFCGKVDGGIPFICYAYGYTDGKNPNDNDKISPRVETLHDQSRREALIPQTTPETVMSDLTKLRDANSDLSTSIRHNFEKGMMRAIRKLPEYKPKK